MANGRQLDNINAPPSINSQTKSGNFHTEMNGEVNVRGNNKSTGRKVMGERVQKHETGGAG